MTSFTVPNVADLGPEVNRYVVVIWSHSQVTTGSCVAGREFMAGAMANVQPGQTVDAGELTFRRTAATSSSSDRRSKGVRRSIPARVISGS